MARLLQLRQPGFDSGVGFAELEAAQAEGDLVALRGRGRPAIRIDDLGLLER